MQVGLPWARAAWCCVLCCYVYYARHGTSPPLAKGDPALGIFGLDPRVLAFLTHIRISGLDPRVLAKKKKAEVEHKKVSQVIFGSAGFAPPNQLP